MENFEELEKTIYHVKKIDEYIKKVKTIGFVGRHGSKEYIGITEINNNIYDSEGVCKIIGDEKLENIIHQFRGLINVELQNAKEEAEKELSRFKVFKNDL